MKDPKNKKASPVGSTTYCLTSRTGNCTDFESLWTSFARSIGIPTQIVYGSFLKPDLMGQDQDQSYHCWAEFYAPGLGWIPHDVAVADLRRRGARSIVVAGHSLGGTAAVAYGANHDDLAGVIGFAAGEAYWGPPSQLPDIARALAGRAELWVAGAGYLFSDLQARATTLPSVRLLGPCDDARMQTLYAAASVVVIPSLWPEPFGFVGLEAMAHGRATVAFARGGIN